MHVDAEAFAACQRIDLPDFAVAVADNIRLAAVALESCSRHEELLGAFQQLPGAWRGRHRGMGHRRQRQHHSRYQKVRVHSSMPGKGQSRDENVMSSAGLHT